MKELGKSTESNKKYKYRARNYRRRKIEDIIEQIQNSYVFVKVGFLNKLITEKCILDYFKDNDEDSQFFLYICKINFDIYKTLYLNGII